MESHGRTKKEKIDVYSFELLAYRHLVNSEAMPYSEDPAHKLPDYFIRIHRSFTIAIDKIEAVQGNSVEIDGVKYVIGRSYIEHVKNRILQ